MYLFFSEFISALENYSISQVATGNAHSLAVNEWGQVFSWGSGTAGQLGYETDVNQINPKIIRTLATKHVVQIASGHYHSLALTNSKIVLNFLRIFFLNL